MGPGLVERARRDEAARGALRGGVSAPGSITTAIWASSIGRRGTIVYRFGRDTLPSGGVIRWNGVGIAGTSRHASQGGGVRQSAAGRPIRNYGLTIVLEHGNGYYSVYATRDGRCQTGGLGLEGGVIGTVGGQNSDYGPHLHFEIRGDNRSHWTRRCGFGGISGKLTLPTDPLPDCAFPCTRAASARANRWLVWTAVG